LLLRAFELATATDDRKNALYVALSLANLYITQLANPSASEEWLHKSQEFLGAGDDSDRREHMSIQQAVKKQRDGEGTPPN
jgi:hypothetical protein